MDHFCYNCMHRLDSDDAVCPNCGAKNSTEDENVQHLPCGVVLNKRYMIGRVLGEGGFGITYIGRDLNLDMIIAVKEFFPVGFVSRNCNANTTVSITGENSKGFFEKGKSKFIQEARILGKFSGNKSIVDVRDFFEDNNTAYIVMEYIDGVTLSKYINENGPFSFDDLFQKLLPVLNALSQIHQKGLIHRDISPDNIMIMKDGSLKLMDFGASREVNYEDKRSLSIVLRPGYAPEEQYRSKGKQGPWTDIYALCATIYKCISGVTPDESMERMFNDELKPPSTHGAKIAPYQEQALMKGMAVYQQHRFRNIEELIAAFSGKAAVPDTQRTVAASAQVPPRRKEPVQRPPVQAVNNAQRPAPVAKNYGQRTVTQQSVPPYNAQQNSPQYKPQQNVPQYKPQQNVPQQKPAKKAPSKKMIGIIAAVLAVLIVAGVVIGVVAATNSKGKSSDTSAANSIASSDNTGSDKDDGSGSGNNADSGSANGGTSKATDTAVTTDGDFISESYFGDENNISLKVWAPSNAVSLTQEMVEDFKSHYPNITFTDISVVAQSESEVSTIIINDPDAGADVFGFPSDTLDRLQAAQVLAPLSVDISKFVSQENSETSVNVVTSNNDLYAFPETGDNGYFLVYDRSIVSDSDATTLEGVLEACKKAGRQFVMDCGNGFYSCTFAFTGGVTIDGFESDGTTQKFVDYDEDEAVSTIMAFASLMKTYKGTFISNSATQISSGFNGKTVAAGIDGTWDFAAHKQALGDNFGVAKLPTISVNGTKKQMIGIMGQKLLGVNSHSKFPRASQMLAYYLAGKTCQQKRAESLGWGPTNLVAQSALSDVPVMQVIFQQIAFSVPQVNIAGTFWTPMGTLGSEIYKDTWKADDKEATRQLLQTVIANIRDE